MTAILASDRRVGVPSSQPSLSSHATSPLAHDRHPAGTSSRLVAVTARRDSPIWSGAGAEPARASDPVDFVFGVAMAEAERDAGGSRVAHLVLAGIASDSIDAILGDGTDVRSPLRGDLAASALGDAAAPYRPRFVC